MIVTTKPFQMFRACQMALVLGLLQLAGVAHAQWHWIDNQGLQVFSDRPPGPEIPDKNVLQRPNPLALQAPSRPSPSASAPAVGQAAASKPNINANTNATILAAADAAKAQKEAEARVAEQNKATKAKNCSAAQRQLITLKSGIRIAKVNDKGEREFLDDKAIAAEIKQAQKYVESECN